MNYWLMKTEPSTFSIDDLAREGHDEWEGVRNYQARNNMMAMHKGDLSFIYHSSYKQKGIVGVARIVESAHPDLTALDPKSHYYDSKATPDKPIWQMVSVEFVEKFPRVILLSEIKNDENLVDMKLIQASRLSVQPVTKAEFDHICKLAKI